MAVTNSSVCTEKQYFQSNCDISTTLSISRYSVTTGLLRKNNVTCFDKYSKNITDTTNKFRRAKRSENKLNHDEYDYAFKSSHFSEPPNEINKPHDIANQDNNEYSNNLYDYNYNSKHNADVGKHYIDEPQYIVESKKLSTLTQNEKSLHLSKPMYRNIPKNDVMNDIDLMSNKIDQQQIISLNNLNKNEHQIQLNQLKNQLNQNHVLNQEIKLNFLEDDNNRDNELLKLSNETKLMDKALHHMDSDYRTPMYKHNIYTVENTDELREANKAKDENNAQGTITSEYANKLESLVKHKYKREREQKHPLHNYGSANTLMIEKSRRLSSDDGFFTFKLITSAIQEQKTLFTRPGFRKEEANFFRQLEEEALPESTTRQLRFGMLSND